MILKSSWNHKMFLPMTLEANSQLQSDHIGFHDSVYRQRRNEIVALSQTYNDKLRNYPIIKYLPSEIETWRTVFTRLDQLYPSMACISYLNGLEMLKKNKIFVLDDIPRLKDVSDFLEIKTGFRLYPVSGLLSPKQFLQGLASKIFYCTQYIRHPSKPFYTPEPDIIHEMLGHVPMFLDEDICEISEMIGRTAMKCSENKIKELEKIYWFTIEFGLLMENNKYKIYGAGILSSIDEIERIRDGKVVIHPFDLKKIVGDEPLITELQMNYYSISCISDLKNMIQKYLIEYLT